MNIKLILKSIVYNIDKDNKNIECHTNILPTATTSSLLHHASPVNITVMLIESKDNQISISRLIKVSAETYSVTWTTIIVMWVWEEMRYSQEGKGTIMLMSMPVGSDEIMMERRWKGKHYKEEREGVYNAVNDICV